MNTSGKKTGKAKGGKTNWGQIADKSELYTKFRSKLKKFKMASEQGDKTSKEYWWRRRLRNRECGARKGIRRVLR
jgi:hypothetical protein